MPAPMPFPLHAQLRRVLCVTAAAWGLNMQQRRGALRAPQFGTAPVTREILAEQQAIADAFFDLKLIPKKLNLLHAAPVGL